MTLADLFDEIDILDISFSELKKLIKKNKAVRSDYDFDKLKLYVRAYKKYMSSDWSVSLKEFTRLEGIEGNRLSSFIIRYGLDIRSSSIKIKAALAYKRENPSVKMVDIARKFDCHVQTLYKYTSIKRTEEQKIKNKQNKLNVVKAYEYYLSNNCTKHYAEMKFNVYKGAISRFIKKLNNGGHIDERTKGIQIQSVDGIKDRKLYNGCR